MTVRVFLLEDMKQLRGIVADLLEGLGGFAVVGMAGTEAEANLWLSENSGQWDLAVIDLILEEGTGMGVIAKCKARPPAAKVVVFSDFVTPGILQHCLRLGADAAIPKSDWDRFVEFCNDVKAAAE